MLLTPKKTRRMQRFMWELIVIELVTNPYGVSQVNHCVDEVIESVLETLVSTFVKWNC